MVLSIVSALFVAFILGIWGYVLFRILFVQFYNRKKEYEDASNGKFVSGTVKRIHSSKKTGGGKWNILSIEIEFPNFAYELISERFSFTDTKPEQRRYEEGKSVQLILNEKKEASTPVRIANARGEINRFGLAIILALIGGYCYGVYLLLTKSWEAIGQDINNLPALFPEEDNLGMGLVALFTGLFVYFLFKKIGLLQTGKAKNELRQLKYHGRNATATIERYEDTGVLINDNPKVRFHYSYADNYGTTYQGQDSKVINKLEIGTIQQIKEVEIMYFSDRPEVSKLKENLIQSSAMGCIGKAVLYFLLFIFSTIILGNFIHELYF